jgi:hypothetical protein
VVMRCQHRTTSGENDAFTGWRHVIVRMRRASVRKAIKQKLAER